MEPQTAEAFPEFARVLCPPVLRLAEFEIDLGLPERPAGNWPIPKLELANQPAVLADSDRRRVGLHLILKLAEKPDRLP